MAPFTLNKEKQAMDNENEKRATLYLAYHPVFDQTLGQWTFYFFGQNIWWQT